MIRWMQPFFMQEKMIKEGADILDVGGESTRPGHVQIYGRRRDRARRSGHLKN